MSTQLDTDRLERVLNQLDGIQKDFTEEEQDLFAGLLRQGLRETLPQDMVQRAEAEAAGDAPAALTDDAGAAAPDDEAAKRVADSIMELRDGLQDDEDRKLVDSLMTAAAAPEDDDDVQGHVWVFKWDIGAPTNGSVYTFYRNMCNNTASNAGKPGGGYLAANFGTFWTHYRCWVWY